MTNLFDLTGKRALVTGGGRGLGLGMAEGLAEAGAKVVILGSSDAVMKAAETLRSKGLDVTGLQGDLSDRAGIPAVFDKAVALLGGGIDILLNNAGVQRRNHCEDFTLEDWDTVIGVNLNAVFVLCQLAGRKMLEQGGAVGRKLDFLIQEFNREANTIGSKCNDTDLARVVVDIKAEIEKIREQVQNLE